MLEISEDQFRTFVDARVARLSADLTSHAARYFPDIATELGPEGVAQTVESTVSAAAQMGICTEASFKLLNLKLVLGRTFETDPQSVWTKAYLEDASVGDVNDRVRRLHAALLARMTQEAKSASARRAFADA